MRRPPPRSAAARVVVDGEPGVGKTRLLQELADHAPVPVAWGRSPDHEAVPALWPWEQILATLAELRGGRVLAG